MSEQPPSMPESGQTVDQLLEEFVALNEEARQIQSRLAEITQQLAERAARASRKEPSSRDTVRY